MRDFDYLRCSFPRLFLFFFGSVSDQKTKKILSLPKYNCDINDVQCLDHKVLDIQHWFLFRWYKVKCIKSVRIHRNYKMDDCVVCGSKTPIQCVYVCGSIILANKIIIRVLTLPFFKVRIGHWVFSIKWSKPTTHVFLNQLFMKENFLINYERL